jgi:hypothetical protein
VFYPPSDALPIDPSTLLFTITTTATASNGATADLREDVYAAVKFDDLGSELQTRYASDCSWFGPFDKYSYIRSRLSMTVTSADGKKWPGAKTYSGIAFSMGPNPAFIGDVSGFQAYCNTAILHPGSANGASLVLPTAKSDEVGGWAKSQYGFSIANDGIDDLTLFPVFSNCAITIGPAGTGSAVAKKWPTAKQRADNTSCQFGTWVYFDPLAG